MAITLGLPRRLAGVGARRLRPARKNDKVAQNIHEFEFEDFELIDYEPHPAIKAPISI